MTHTSRKWLRCGESICFPLTDSVPVARRKNSAPTIPDRSPVYHSCPSPRQPQLRCQLSPGSHQHTADACSPPGARPGAAVFLGSGSRSFLPAQDSSSCLPSCTEKLWIQVIPYQIPVPPCTLQSAWAWPDLSWESVYHFVLHCVNHTQYSSCINHCTEIKKEVCTHFSWKARVKEQMQTDTSGNNGHPYHKQDLFFNEAAKMNQLLLASAGYSHVLTNALYPTSRGDTNAFFL